MTRWLVVVLAFGALLLGVDRGRNRWAANRTLATVEQISLQMIRSGKATAPAVLANAAALKKAQAQDPANVAIVMARGSQFVLLDRPGSAIEIYEQALRLEPRAEIYLNLGRVYLRIGRKARAHEYFETAIELDPMLELQLPDSMRQVRGDS